MILTAVFAADPFGASPLCVLQLRAWDAIQNAWRNQGTFGRYSPAELTLVPVETGLNQRLPMLSFNLNMSELRCGL